MTGRLCTHSTKRESSRETQYLGSWFADLLSKLLRVSDEYARIASAQFGPGRDHEHRRCIMEDTLVYRL